MKSDYTRCVLYRFPALFLPIAIGLWAQDAPAERKPSDYPAQTRVGGAQLAAEFLGHSLPAAHGMIDVPDYLVIEVAIYPRGLVGFAVADRDFTLRLNGRTLAPQAPGMVAASVQYPDWTQKPRVVADAGINGQDVTLGAPPGVGRFPGDPRQQGPIARPRAPDEVSDSVQREQEPPVEQTIQHAALATQLAHGPVRGLLFFNYHGKLKNVHTVELIFNSATEGKAALKL